MPAWMPPQKKESSIPIDEVTNSWSNMLHDQDWYFLQTILFSLQDLLALLRNSQFTRRVYTTGNQSIEVQVSLIIRKLSVPNNMHLNMSLLYLFTLVCFHSFIHSFQWGCGLAKSVVILSRGDATKGTWCPENPEEGLCPSIEVIRSFTRQRFVQGVGLSAKIIWCRLIFVFFYFPTLAEGSLSSSSHAGGSNAGKPNLRTRHVSLAHWQAISSIMASAGENGNVASSGNDSPRVRFLRVY